eukprot:gnl/MRDRNA2_/MRDRNA2_141074_c0_seq1.p2 gnl/MRDRNA2_/MRDRNA2_141074_c0~~gnl/MRDRNA2_/MRDRNA2_141074_c0_seq1.p2  ORF type:complete len:110 (+),score=25.23 gnl/MRDRNA2_/MRDRNA2_141074_c0_seq1:469-798(+)
MLVGDAESKNLHAQVDEFHKAVLDLQASFDREETENKEGAKVSAAENVAKEEANHEDVIARCNEIACEVQDQIMELKSKQDYVSYQRIILEKFGELIGTCPTLPRKSLS